MAQLQKRRSKTATTVSTKQSIALVKNLTNVSVSSIFYQRGVLDPQNFSAKPINQTPAMMIDVEKASAEACRIQRWISEGLSDAIEKQYLKKMELILAEPTPPDVPDEEGRLIERYSFNYQYAADGSVRAWLGRTGRVAPQRR